MPAPHCRKCGWEMKYGHAVMKNPNPDPSGSGHIEVLHEFFICLNPNKKGDGAPLCGYSCLLEEVFPEDAARRRQAIDPHRIV